MKNLPTTHPLEVIEASPEALECANIYLQTQSLEKTALALNIAPQTCGEYLNRPEIKSYINLAYSELGFNNRFKLRGLLDAIIDRKLRDMDETETGSSKDILEILTLSHKITQETLQREIELEKLKQSNLKSQTNIQINGGGNNYSQLLERLIKDA